ncbi:hypothetical protein LINPERPRIM_LOCUS10925 [Linum perenne]
MRRRRRRSCFHFSILVAATTGWRFPVALARAGQLTNLSMMSCNLDIFDVDPVAEQPTRRKRFQYTWKEELIAMNVTLNPLLRHIQFAQLLVLHQRHKISDFCCCCWFFRYILLPYCSMVSSALRSNTSSACSEEPAVSVSRQAYTHIQ